MTRVLAARLDSAGDVLLMGPALRALAHDADVTLLCGPRGRAAAALLPEPGELLTFHAPWIDAEPEPVDREAVEQLVADVAARRFDEAVVFTSFHQSALPLALLLRMAGVPVIAAMSEDYPGSLLDVRHRPPDDLHEVERALSLVGSLGHRLPPGDDARLRVRVPPGAPVPFDGEPFVVVHPGASVPARAWSPSRCGEAVAALVDAGRRVAVTGSRDEAVLTAHVAGCRPGVVDLGGRLQLGQLAGVLAAADAVVVGNTGPAHLAAAVGTPVVSLFAATVPAVRWRPWMVAHVLLGDQDVPCSGCRARVCPVAGHPCLGAVTAADVVAAVDALTAHRQQLEVAR